MRKILLIGICLFNNKKGEKKMKKVIEYMMHNGDKVMHLLVCMVIVMVISRCDMLIWNRPMNVAVAIALFVALFIGIVKELIDFFRYGWFDVKDLLFDLVGAVIGGLLFVFMVF